MGMIAIIAMPIKLESMAKILKAISKEFPKASWRYTNDKDIPAGVLPEGYKGPEGMVIFKETEQ
jgi:hypothetical protein